ncbi:TrbL/VirB6 plasmid conjugal transfer protein [Anaeromyxobacter dehalogenans 2CP-1]|uniref:TrbL/VirB6 plasmid conjugal transfer protein n=1 Tax=Anaeromyxobacter dehalogenans (strain ATCC BAA-258 / DSM 21875 / 2CP-1) TaxID=455488 RepID=B8JFP7_ANAD2|nr:type IV secretion system protein [Anaeromyxobacter dehalogenans]ACL64485.1 TrbL/VirB6 plasmid conjugal transfer protein [Anaeromyxobacter dehalogenans 2CP-1]
MFRLFTPLFAELDRISTAFAQDVSSRVIVAITPVLAAGLTVWFIAWGILVMRGAVDQPVREFLGKVIRTALIVSVALGAGLYQRDVVEVIRTVPDDLAAAVAGGEANVRFGAGPLDTGSTQAALIDRAAGQGLLKAEDAFEKGGLMTQQGIAFYTFGVLMLLATVVMVGVGGALILVAKVMLALLAGLGPLFIAALLFDATRRFFDRWIAMIATYALVVVLFAAVFTFMLAIFANYMSGVALDGNMNVAYGIGGALILTVVSVAILKELHHLAVGLGGGYAHRILLLERSR